MHCNDCVSFGRHGEHSPGCPKRMDQDLADSSEDLGRGADVCMHADDATTCTRCAIRPTPIPGGRALAN